MCSMHCLKLFCIHSVNSCTDPHILISHVSEHNGLFTWGLTVSPLVVKGINGDYLQIYRICYVGIILLRKFDGRFSIQNMIFYQSERGYPNPQCFSVHLPFSIFFFGVELKLCLLPENVNILLRW